MFDGFKTERLNRYWQWYDKVMHAYYSKKALNTLAFRGGNTTVILECFVSEEENLC